MTIKTNNLNYFQNPANIAYPTNLQIGIYGGSFNPPHQGHLYIAQQAIIKLNLNILLWLVTPLNPLKTEESLNLKQRISLSQSLTAFDYKIKVSHFEESFSNYSTYFILDKLKLLSHHNSLIWIMGDDNLNNFHLFKHWQYILQNNKIAVFSRSTSSFHTLLQRSSFIYKSQQIGYFNHKMIRNCNENHQESWLKFFLLPKNSSSSSEIRAK